jgi:hypothetical protein
MATAFVAHGDQFFFTFRHNLRGRNTYVSTET